MDAPEQWDPYPIVLPGWYANPAWGWIVVLTIVSLAILVIGVGSGCDGCGPQWIAPGTIGMLFAIGLTLSKIRGARDRDLRIDRSGFVVNGERVPWEAVIAIGWVPKGEGHSYVEVRVRDRGTYTAPRFGTVGVDHSVYGLKPNTLIYLFEAAALPRRILVTSIEPPPAA